MHLNYAPALVLVALVQGTLCQDKCDHRLDDKCVDAYGDALFSFKPLFSESPKFGYGFRVTRLEERGKGPFEHETDDINYRLWVSYDNATLRPNGTANRSTRMAYTMTNSSRDVGGGNNGCDGLLGKKCVENLKDILTWSILNDDDYEGFTNMETFKTIPLTNLSCPVGIFDDFSGIPTEGTDFLSEFNSTSGSPGYDDDSRDVPYKSGSALKPWGGGNAYRSGEEQMAYAAVGIAARYPPASPRKYDDVQLEVVCTRAKPVPGSEDRIDPSKISHGSDTGDSNDDDDDDESVAVTIGIKMQAFIVAALSFAAVALFM